MSRGEGSPYEYREDRNIPNRLLTTTRTLVVRKYSINPDKPSTYNFEKVIYKA